MRVALLSDVFAKNMGYLENILPKYFARLGVDVHVITMDLPPYYWMNGHKETYAGFADGLQAGAVEVIDGYTLHVLSHAKVAGYMRMVGLRETNPSTATSCSPAATRPPQSSRWRRDSSLGGTSHACSARWLVLFQVG